MRDYDNLTALLRPPQDWYDALVYEFAIEVILRLIDDEWSIAVCGEHDRQKHGLLLA
jgi:hypothetical protein